MSCYAIVETSNTLIRHGLLLLFLFGRQNNVNNIYSGVDKANNIIERENVLH